MNALTILAIGCHPDDCEIFCGGTLAAAAAAGNHVTICHVADGDKGSFSIPPDELRETRRGEAQAAAALIGADSVCLGVHDLEVATSSELVPRLVALMRHVRPDYIITHNPTDYMRDHEATSTAVLEASFAATVPSYASGSAPLPEALPVFFMDTNAGLEFQPTQFVDISEAEEMKTRMIECHKSQLEWLAGHDSLDIVTAARRQASFRGLQCGVSYAEGFRCYHAVGRLRPYRLLP